MTTEPTPITDEESDTEECLLLVEFNGVIDEDFLNSCKESNDPIQILGLETDAPMLQLGGCTFEGSFEDTLGTTIVFEKQSSSPSDANGTKPTQLEDFELMYRTKTNKKLNLNRIFLNKKKTNEEESQ